MNFSNCRPHSLTMRSSVSMSSLEPIPYTSNTVVSKLQLSPYSGSGPSVGSSLEGFLNEMRSISPIVSGILCRIFTNGVTNRLAVTKSLPPLQTTKTLIKLERRASSPDSQQSTHIITPSSCSLSPSLFRRSPSVCLTVSPTPHSLYSVRYILPSAHCSIDNSNKMDFDPHGSKWQCCCCNLPTGLKILSIAEISAFSVIASISLGSIFSSDQINATWFSVCLVIMSLCMAFSSILLFIGIHIHKEKLLYPTIFARLLLVVFVQVFGVSQVLAPHEETVVETATLTYENGKWNKKNEVETPPSNIALRLVFLVFAMLFLSVIVFYCVYLVVRCIRYEQQYSRLKERRASLIHAGMIDRAEPELANERLRRSLIHAGLVGRNDPDFSDCRRPSNC